MSPQLIKNISSALKYILAIAGFALMQTLAVRSIVDMPIQHIILDAFFHATVYALIALLIFNTLKFGRFQSLLFIQQALIYIALIALSLVIIAFTSFALYNWIFLFENKSEVFIHILPLRLFLSILVLLMIFMYARIKLNDTATEQLTIGELDNKQEQETKTPETNTLESIAIKSGQKIHVIPLDEIIYLQADGDYVQIFTEKGKYLKEQTLKYFEENLPQKLFVRIHRSYIVHVQSIARIELYDKQNQQLSLKNGTKLKISQSGYKTLRSKLKL